MTINEDENELIFRAETFKKLELPVHISKNDGSWKNGKIKSITRKYILLIENKEGIIPIFFKDIKKDGINKYTEAKK